ncbi:MAG: ATP-binding protein [Desulfurococcales archaeon]|nr:ATP-binding protein [Desulfurococcales archaeon]
MKKIFVNRDSELDILFKETSMPGLRTIIIYGRRRIGKTWLLKAFKTLHKNIHYILVPEAPTKTLLQIIAQRLQPVCHVDDAKNWEEILEKLASCAREQHTIILVLDEFQRLGPSFAVALQLLHDTDPDAPLKIILSASAVSATERLAGPLGPLYGRSRLIPIRGFNLLEAYTYLHEKLGAKPLQAFRLYAILGGSPFNLSLADTLDWRQIALDHIHSLYGRLYEEPIHTLNSETREPGTYLAILHTASGTGAPYKKIAQITGRTSLTKYIETLKSLGLITRLTPYGSKPSTRTSWYHITDPYWDYWIQNIYPYREEAELLGVTPLRLQQTQKHFSMWFEREARKLLSIIHKSPAKPWWRRDIEIDAVVPFQDGVKVYEIKYAELDENQTYRLLGALKNKAKHLNQRIASLGIIAIKTPEIPGAETWTLEKLLYKALQKKRVSIHRV